MSDASPQVVDPPGRDGVHRDVLRPRGHRRRKEMSMPPESSTNEEPHRQDGPARIALEQEIRSNRFSMVKTGFNGDGVQEHTITIRSSRTRCVKKRQEDIRSPTVPPCCRVPLTKDRSSASPTVAVSGLFSSLPSHHEDPVAAVQDLGDLVGDHDDCNALFGKLCG